MYCMYIYMSIVQIHIDPTLGFRCTDLKKKILL